MVILGMAWSMLQAQVSGTKQTAEEAEESAVRPAIAIVPMAMPLLAGPGSISLMIIVAGQTSGLLYHIGVLLVVSLVATSAWVILLAAGPIASGLGKTGMNVATRFMGLILLATAVEFVTSGLAAIFPGWTVGA
jgi:multiple antibiotic resistance protein